MRHADGVRRGAEAVATVVLALETVGCPLDPTSILLESLQECFRLAGKQRIEEACTNSSSLSGTQILWEVGRHYLELTTALPKTALM